MSDKLCMGCMNALPDDAETCPVCGYPAGGENPSQYLPVNTLLSDRYLVGRVLDVGGDSVRYLGYDRELRSPIMIREFFPGTLCERGENHAVLVLGGCELPFREYLDKFRRHVRALARMRELPAMIPIYDILEENATVYAVSEPEEGVTLESRLAEIGGRMRWADARPLFMPLLSSLISLHSAGIYHLGLCPQNLLIAPDGKLRLRGFYLPEARFASTEITPSLPDGYAAPEQYGFDTDITAATDVYGFVATLFRTLSGVVPPVGSKRAANSGDLFLSADVARELPDQVAAVLFNGLQVNAAARIPSLTVLEDQLATAPAVTALLQDEPEELPVKSAKKDKSAKNKTPLIIIGVVFALLVLIGGGDIAIPESVKDDVYDLGFVSKQDKYNAMAAAALLCQPSHNESFSLVIMESWLCGRPVLVSSQCAVTKDFAKRSNGGLYFKDYFEFEGCVQYILQNPEAAAELGANGGAFVRENFEWDVIVEKYRTFFQKLMGA